MCGIYVGESISYSRQRGALIVRADAPRHKAPPKIVNRFFAIYPSNLARGVSSNCHLRQIH
jgi:hypothetical protein